MMVNEYAQKQANAVKKASPSTLESEYLTTLRAKRFDSVPLLEHCTSGSTSHYFSSSEAANAQRSTMVR